MSTTGLSPLAAQAGTQGIKIPPALKQKASKDSSPAALFFKDAFNSSGSVTKEEEIEKIKNLHAKHLPGKPLPIARLQSTKLDDLKPITYSYETLNTLCKHMDNNNKASFTESEKTDLLQSPAKLQKLLMKEYLITSVRKNSLKPIDPTSLGKLRTGNQTDLEEEYEKTKKARELFNIKTKFDPELPNRDEIDGMTTPQLKLGIDSYTNKQEAINLVTSKHPNPESIPKADVDKINKMPHEELKIIVNTFLEKDIDTLYKELENERIDLKTKMDNYHHDGIILHSASGPFDDKSPGTSLSHSQNNTPPTSNSGNSTPGTSTPPSVKPKKNSLMFWSRWQKTPN